MGSYETPWCEFFASADDFLPWRDDFLFPASDPPQLYITYTSFLILHLLSVFGENTIVLPTQIYSTLIIILQPRRSSSQLSEAVSFWNPYLSRELMQNFLVCELLSDCFTFLQMVDNDLWALRKSKKSEARFKFWLSARSYRPAGSFLTWERQLIRKLQILLGKLLWSSQPTDSRLKNSLTLLEL